MYIRSYKWEDVQENSNYLGTCPLRVGGGDPPPRRPPPKRSIFFLNRKINEHNEHETILQFCVLFAV